MTIDKILFVSGLTLDIVGALFLAQGLMSKRLDRLTYEGTSGFGSPPNLRYISSALEQKAEAQIGFCLLALGFVVQSLDYFLFDPPSSWILPRSVVLIAAIAFGLTTYSIGRRVGRMLLRRSSVRMAAWVLTEKLSDDPSWTVQVADHLLPWFARGSTEDDAAFAVRVRRLITTAHRR